MAKKQEKTVVVPMNLLSVESMATQLKTVSPATLEVFKSFENLDSAHADSEIKTIALLEEYTADGILAEEIVETFETRMKELELWPFTTDEKGEVKWLGIVPAKQIALAPKIRERLYHATVTKLPVLDGEGLLQFHAVKDSTVVQTKRNTTAEGGYTRGKGRGDVESQFEIKKRETKEAGGSTGNAELPNPEGAKEVAKSTAEGIRMVETAFGAAWTHTKAIQVLMEKFRPLLALEASGKAFLAEFEGQLEQSEQNLVDLSEALNMKTKDGKFFIALKKSA